MKYSKFNMSLDLSWFKNTVLFSFLIVSGCQAQVNFSESKNLLTGAEQTHLYINTLRNKTVAVVANQTSMVANTEGDFTHLVDTLLTLDIKVKAVFAPEHGFRGKADAGEIVNDSMDAKTGLPIISLYGNHKKPTKKELDGIDIVVFDIQDVGVRFYTYISTLHNVMEACAEQNIPIIVLDRPNPNRHYIDGPVLEKAYRSFVGMHTVPVVYGMTIGEYAQMINGEGWLNNGIVCDLEVITLKNYDPTQFIELPIKPSPNLPNAKSINLYPSLCFFEGTNVNAGRGTALQFQIFGSPFLDNEYFEFEFKPEPNEGSKYPKHRGIVCYGRDLRTSENLSSINLEWLIEAYTHTLNQDKFFNSFFTILAGTPILKQQILRGLSVEEIRASWQEDIADFMKIRSLYLLY